MAAMEAQAREGGRRRGGTGRGQAHRYAHGISVLPPEVQFQCRCTPPKPASEWPRWRHKQARTYRPSTSGKPSRAASSVMVELGVASAQQEAYNPHELPSEIPASKNRQEPGQRPPPSTERAACRQTSISPELSRNGWPALEIEATCARCARDNHRAKPPSPASQPSPIPSSAAAAT